MALCASLLLGGAARADGFELQQFRPACGDADVLAVSTARVRHSGPMSTVVLGNWADSPLRLATSNGSLRVVNSEQQVDAGFTIALPPRLEATLVIPIAAEQGDRSTSNLVVSRNEPFGGFSDLRLQSKASVIEGEKAAVAGLVMATLPTGSSNNLRGHGGPTLAPGVAAEFKTAGETRILGNASLLIRDQRYAIGVLIGNAVRYGVGLESGPRWRGLGVLCTLTGEAGLPRGGTGRNPAEALLGLRYRSPHSRRSFVFAAGPGLGTGYGAPRFRVVAGMSFGAPAHPDHEVVRDSAPEVAETPRPTIATETSTTTAVETTGKQLAIVDRTATTLPEERPAAPNLEQRIPFPFKSAAIDDAGNDLVAAVADILREHPEVRLVQIRGFADDQGDSDFNASVSVARANAVRNALVNAGIDASRLEAVGLSSQNPVDESHSPEAHALNRRVEFRILDITR